MASVAFAAYLHPEVAATSRPRETIRFVGQSLPYYDQVRAALAGAVAEYPALPLARAELTRYRTVHDDAYLDAIQRAARGDPTVAPLPVNAECAGLEHCLPGYAHSLGGLVAAIDRMRQGSLERAYCFSLGGHHAFPERGHGYCLLNPLAAAARYAQQLGFRRVLILDWDIHHGDGTQAIFAGDSSIYCISVHSAVDLYMAKASRLALGTTTAAEEAGHWNIPVLDQRFDGDVIGALGLSGRFYRGEESLVAVADALDALPWQPELICVFSGYDAHRDDCGRHVMGWDTADFGWLTRRVLDRAQQAGCPVLSVHGGGYKLPVTIAAATEHIRTLATYRP
jgi:acetoin utilization deacetylase AcuC-like enzyme